MILTIQIIILIFTIPVFADFTKGACKEDAIKFCGELHGLERGKCMSENFDKLSSI